MAVTVLFSLPTTEFSLGEVLTPNADVEVELERIVPAGDPVHYFWVGGDQHSTIAEDLRTASIVNEVTVVDELPDRTLLRVHWNHDADGLLQEIDEFGGVVLAATGRVNEWKFQLRFPSQGALSQFYQQCTDRGLPLQIREFIPQSPFQEEKPFDLSEPQQEAIRIAFERGYFDVPRQTTITELADELGISTQAVSERLRRGLTTLLLSTVGNEPSTAETTESDESSNGTNH